MASTVKLNIKGGPERSFMACCRIVLVVAVVTLTACAETRPKHDATGSNGTSDTRSCNP